VEAASAFVGDVLTAATGRRWDEPLGLPQSIGSEGVMTSEEQLWEPAEDRGAVRRRHHAWRTSGSV